MLVYIANVTLAFVSLFASFAVRQRIYGQLTLLSLVTFLIFTYGTRYGIGNDYYGLVSLYETFTYDAEIRRREPVFYIFSSFSSWIGMPGHFVVFLYTFISYAAFISLFRHPRWCLALLLFVSLSGMTFFLNDQARQGAAVALLMSLWGSRWAGPSVILSDRRMVLIFFIGSCVHFSVVVLAGIYIGVRVLEKRFVSRVWVFLPIFGLALAPAATGVFTYLLGLTPETLGERFLFKPSVYTPMEYQFPTLLIFQIAFFYTQVLCVKLTSESELRFTMYLSVGFFLYAIFYDIFIATRVFSVFFYFSGLLFATYLAKPNCRRYKWIWGVGSGLTLVPIFLSYLISGGGRHGGVPYVFIFSGWMG